MRDAVDPFRFTDDTQFFGSVAAIAFPALQVHRLFHVVRCGIGAQVAQFVMRKILARDEEMMMRIDDAPIGINDVFVHLREPVGSYGQRHLGLLRGGLVRVRVRYRGSVLESRRNRCALDDVPGSRLM